MCKIAFLPPKKYPLTPQKPPPLEIVKKHDFSCFFTISLAVGDVAVQLLKCGDILYSVASIYEYKH